MRSKVYQSRDSNNESYGNTVARSQKRGTELTTGFVRSEKMRVGKRGVG